MKGSRRQSALSINYGMGLNGAEKVSTEQFISRGEEAKERLDRSGHLHPCPLSRYKPISFPTEGQGLKTESCSPQTFTSTFYISTETMDRD